MVKRKKIDLPFSSGLLIKLNVYEMGAIIGNGFVLHTDNGSISHPQLVDLKGERLPEGWYNLQVTGDSCMVVIPKRKQ